MEKQTELFKNAKWIGSTTRVCGRNQNTPTPTLRAIKRFCLDVTPREAIVRVSGLGAFVLYINGKRVSDEVLAPGFTDYQKTVLFCEYDVKDMLTRGENVIAIEVGSGFYNQCTTDVWSFSHAPWRDAEKFILSLTVDGAEVVVSDRSWRVKHSGPRYHTQIRQGEYYDATREDGWLSADFDEGAWNCASIVSPPGGELYRAELPPVRICERVAPVSKKRGRKGLIFDFGKNISGVCRIRASAKRGTEVCVHYAEQLSEDGEEISKHGIDIFVDCENQYMDKYTFRGEGTEEFTPEFVYHGFQFAEVIGLDTDDVEIEALFIHTDLREKGGFESSCDMYNWISEVGNRSFLSNYHGFSEDCPHREKNGWTGDAVISAHHAVMRYDMKRAYEKWMHDLVDTQLPSGQISCIAPTAGWGYVWGCGPAWDCALFALPEAIYRETGDTACFDVVFDAAVKYLEYTKHYEDEDGLVCFGLGDWCPPLDENGKKYTVATNEFSDGCHYLLMLRIMKLMCDLRGDSLRAESYEKRAERLLSAIRNKYVTKDDVDNGTASARAMAIYFGIVEGEAKAALAAKLAKQVEDFGYRIPCGILGMKAMFTALSENGYTEVASRIALCDEYPSYGYWRKMGATSMWESWDVKTNSRNHHMYSEIVNWLYRYVGGIKNDGIAYDKCTVSPYLFAPDASASVFTETPRGKLSVEWSLKDGCFRSKTVIPEGTDATLAVAGKTVPLKVGESITELKI